MKALRCHGKPMELKAVCELENGFAKIGYIEHLYFQCKKCGKVEKSYYYTKEEEEQNNE